jgi:hypothetical protein
MLVNLRKLILFRFRKKKEDKSILLLRGWLVMILLGLLVWRQQVVLSSVREEKVKAISNKIKVISLGS